MRRTFLALPLVTLLMFVLAIQPAAAVPPVVVFDESFDDTFVDEETCGVPIEVHSVGRAIHRHYLDQDGNVVKHQTWFKGTDTATNLVTGKSLSGRFSGSDFQREHEGEFGPLAVNGLQFHFTAPGHGAILLDSGRVVFDAETGEVIFLAGPHMVLAGDFEAFCAAMTE